MIRRNFRTDFGSAADYEFMVRLMRLTKLTLAYVPEILVCMKVGGMSNRSLHTAGWRTEWTAGHGRKTIFPRDFSPSR